MSVAIPGYEIIGELGRGGMGIVYKARQTKLGRLVALKMILAGSHAGAADLARFQTEAEAIARLRHPNIVQVYEVGEHEDRPYFSLEFCGGGSLAKKLSGTPLPACEAAALVGTLAGAMQAAHEQHVIHRDLKPANVLLAEDGTPKITDFGLAKKLDEAGQTQSGAIMGTPSYMAPEQAGGKSADIGRAADVYALGAILYECLTGRPPFKAATPLDTILQVISDDPVPPSQLQSKTPRDLETVCLKCLQKEPPRRYATAAALADDLRRFAEGRPIVARPVGRLERAAKWVNRNPALASMAATVALVLVAASAISTGFGIEAGRQAEAARKNEADAIAKGNDLATANETLTRTADDLKRSRDDLETTLARSLLRPLGLQDPRSPVTDPEWEALWELAVNRRDRMGYRFLEEAARTPVTSRQLRNRAELALSAAVGLDEQTRAEVEAWFVARLEDPALPEDEKTDLALAAAAWSGLGSSAAVPVARQLFRAMKDTADLSALHWLAQRLSALAARLDAKDAAQAAGMLVQAIKDTKDATALSLLARGLSAVAARLDAQDAARAAGMLVQAIKDTKDATALYWLAQGLSAVAAGLDARDAAAVSAQAAGILVQAIRDTKDANALRELAQGLSAVAARLDAKDAAQAAGILVQAMKDTKDQYALYWVAQGLSAVAARLDAKDAAQAAGILLQAMKDTKDANGLRWLAEGLSPVAARLDASDAAAVTAPAAGILVQAIKDTKDATALYWLAQGLSAVAARLDAQDAAPAAGILVQAIKDTKGATALPRLAEGLSAVAARLDAKDAAPAAGILVQAMKDTKDPFTLEWLAQGLSAVAARLDGPDAAAVSAQAAGILVQTMKDTKNVNALQVLAEDLSAVAARMEAAQAAGILVQAMKDSQNATAMQALAQGLAAVAARLDAEARSTVLLKGMSHTNDPEALGQLAHGLAAVRAEDIPSRSAMAAAAVALPTGTGHALTALALLIPAAEPPGCPLSSQQLVELLKRPGFVGPARRGVLDHLGSRYHRTFADQWEFVRYAREQHLDLDFTTPPKRPEAVVTTTSKP
jgi:tRNA A-37 threonylcarbamoyl transferase component Bud32